MARLPQRKEQLMDNAIYKKVAAQVPSYDGGPRYLTLADTAALVRATLAREFPGTKFWVRSKSYSGGSSINVYWDGIVDNAWTRIDSFDKPYGPVVTNYNDVDFRDGRWSTVKKPGAPTSKAVDAALAGFESARFDGMIDMGYNVKSWLLPDGSATLGKSSGTVGSMGSDPGYDVPPPDPRAILVSFGSGFIFTNDTVPYDARSAA